MLGAKGGGGNLRVSQSIWKKANPEVMMVYRSVKKQQTFAYWALRYSPELDNPASLGGELSSRGFGAG
jgi:hypothetical protein